jgi:hypothetical protein
MAVFGAVSGEGAGAQEVYVLRRGADTVAIESIFRTTTTLRGQLRDASGALVDYRAELRPDGSVTRVEYSVVPAGDEPGKWQATARFAEREATISVLGGGPESAQLKTAASPMPTFGFSYALFEQLGRRARKVGGTARFTLVRLRQLDTTSVNVRTTRDSVVVTLPQTEIRFRTDASGNLISGRTSPQNLVIERQPAGGPGRQQSTRNSR